MEVNRVYQLKNCMDYRLCGFMQNIYYVHNEVLLNHLTNLFFLNTTEKKSTGSLDCFIISKGGKLIK